MLQFFFDSMIQVSFSVTLIILITLLLSPWIEKRYTAGWKYMVWLLVLMRLLFPFAFVLSEPPIQIPVGQMLDATQSNFSHYFPMGEIQNQTALISTPELNKTSLYSTQVLFYIWLILVIGLSMHTWITYRISRRHINRWSIEATEDQHQILRQIKKDLGLKRPLILKRNPKVKSPLMFGLLNPVILIPTNDYNAIDLSLILKHELIHLQKHHLLVKYVMFLVKTLYWFNPFVYFMSSDLNHTIELCCDEQVIKGNTPTLNKRYMETILDALAHQPIGMTTFSTHYNGGIQIMKNRFKHIMNNHLKKKGLFSLSIFSLLCLIIFTLVACSPKNSEVPNDNASSEVPLETSKPSDTENAENTTADANNVFEIPETITGVPSETQKYPELEKTIIETLDIPEEYFATTQYLYNYVDLNNDGVKEIFTLVMGPYTSGSGGSTALHILVQDDKLVVNQVFTLMREPIIISDQISKSLKELIVYRSGGGAEGSYVTLTSSEGEYQSVNNGTPIESLQGISGIAIMNNDILKDREAGTALYLGE